LQISQWTFDEISLFCTLWNATASSANKLQDQYFELLDCGTRNKSIAGTILKRHENAKKCVPIVRGINPTGQYNNYQVETAVRVLAEEPDDLVSEYKRMAVTAPSTITVLTA
jgi:hypothetical protein